jgi:hypothetical protein
MPTDGQTDMMKAVDFFAVCMHVPQYTSKVMAVGYMPFGCTYFPNFSIYQVLEITLLTSQCQQTLSAQFM